MTALVWGTIVTGVGVLACGVAISRMLLRYRTEQQPEREDRPVVLERYAILERLTSDEDLQFLQRAPGFRPEMAARLRRERRSILRQYLRELAGDFSFLHSAARRLVAEAPEQHADLVGVLLQQQITFWRRLAAIEVKLALAPFGFSTLDVRSLLAPVEALQAAVSPVAA